MREIDLDKMYEQYKNTPNKIEKMWEINESSLNTDSILIQKFNHLEKKCISMGGLGRLKEQLEDIDINKWKEEDFVIGVTKENPQLINLLFGKFPIFNIEEQTQLEKTILDNINFLNVAVLSDSQYYSNTISYLMSVYISQNRPLEYIEKRKNIFYNKYITPLAMNEEVFEKVLSQPNPELYLENLGHIKDEDTNTKKIENGKEDILSLKMQLYLYNKDINITKDKYQFLIDFMNENIFSGKMYDKIKEEMLSYDLTNQEYNKLSTPYKNDKKNYISGMVGRYIYFDDNSTYTESYQYLPESLRKDDGLIRQYLSWIGKVKTIYNKKENYKKYTKKLNMVKEHYIDINAIPFECLNTREKSQLYFYELVLKNERISSIKSDVYHKNPDYFGEYVMANSDFIKSYFTTQDKWLDLMSHVTELNAEYGRKIWNNYLPNEYKKDKNFIVNFFDLESRNEKIEKKYEKINESTMKESLKEELDLILNDSFLDLSAIKLTEALLEEKYRSLFKYKRPEEGHWYSSFDFIIKDIYTELPLELKSDYELQKKYLLSNPPLIEMKDFPFYTLNLEKDLKIINKLLKTHSNFFNPLQ